MEVLVSPFSVIRVAGTVPCVRPLSFVLQGPSFVQDSE